MRTPGWARAMLYAPWRRRFMAFEAVLELIRSRIFTLLPARVYTRTLGIPGATEEHQTDPADQEMAAEIGKLVARVATYLPFRALCLQQVIAVRRMLRRRNCNAVIFLGVRAENINDAHAWLKVGQKVVSGDGDLARYSVLAAFR